VFPNASAAVALIDRLTHHADMIRIEGESYHHREAELTQKKRRSSSYPVAGGPTVDQMSRFPPFFMTGGTSTCSHDWVTSMRDSDRNERHRLQGHLRALARELLVGRVPRTQSFNTKHDSVKDAATHVDEELHSLHCCTRRRQHYE
jgi:hypothetical protein